LNRSAGRVGHVFQGRFRAIVVERESHLLELCRYVVLNPVRARMAAKAEGYRWSSYRATAGLEPEPSWLTTEWVLAQFGTHRAQARARYTEFVQEGAGRASPWGDLRGQALLGSDAFVEQIRPLLEEQAEATEVPRRQRFAHRPTLARLLPRGVLSERVERDQRMREACLVHGYTLSEVGRAAGLHYATVSKVIRQGKT
jgi:putative transposase